MNNDPTDTPLFEDFRTGAASTGDSDDDGESTEKEEEPADAGGQLFDDEVDEISRRVVSTAIADEDEDEDVSKKEIKTWACSYCGYDDPNAVGQCNTCKKWFCNGRGSRNTSHIVIHLVRSKHREIRLHDQSQLGDTVLECYSCGSRNVFVLGFVPAKTDSVVVILCRQPCASQASVKDHEWADETHWRPVIHDQAFLTWIMDTPTEQQMARCQNLSLDMIYALEDLWMRNPKASVDDIGKSEVDKNLPQVLLRYDSACQYRDTLTPLLRAEAECDRLMKEQQHHTNVTVEWSVGLHKRHQVHFVLPNVNWDVKLMPGDELRIRHVDKDFVSEGTVLKVPDSSNDQICLLLRPGVKNIPNDCKSGFQVEFVWKATTFDRMEGALRTFAIDDKCVSNYIYQTVLGKAARADVALKVPLPKRFNGPSLPDLNASQVSAVKAALQRPIALIQGPPGTGKTVTSATIVYHLVRLNRAQVLVCAPSNIAVDQLADKLHRTGLKVVRLCAKSRENVESTVPHLSLHQQMLLDATLRDLQKQRDDMVALPGKDEKRYRELRVKVEGVLLRNADVICTTCICSGDPRLKGMRFRYVLIDESTQAIEPECLVPIVKGAKQIILVGDHCQLGPVVMDKDVASAGLASSLFERMVVLGNRPLRLQVQYRMHPCLSLFSSNYFYEGSLQNGVSELERRLDLPFPWPNRDKPMFFYNVPGREELAGTGTSYLNRAEAQTVEKLVSSFIKAGMMPQQIGVITPYEGQRSYIVQYLQTSPVLTQRIHQAIEIASVDAFQGREKDIIIMSCVRSNELQGIGFLRDPRRLNVALTRAKYGIIIVGNARVLSRAPLWNLLLHHYRDNDVLVEGSLTHLRPCVLQLPKARKLATNARPRGKFLLDGGVFSAENGMQIPPMGAMMPTMMSGGGDVAHMGGPFGPPPPAASSMWNHPPQFFRDPTQFIAPETYRMMNNMVPFALSNLSAPHLHQQQHAHHMQQQQQAHGQSHQRMLPPMSHAFMPGGFNPFLGPQAAAAAMAANNNMAGQQRSAGGQVVPGMSSRAPPPMLAQMMPPGAVGHPAPSQISQSEYKSMMLGFDRMSFDQVSQSGYTTGAKDFDAQSSVSSHYTRVSSWNQHPSMQRK